MTVSTFDPSAEPTIPEVLVLEFTQGAAAQVKSILADMPADQFVGLRVFVQGGGCSGFKYGFSFAEQIEEDDTVVNTDGVILLIDPLSFGYLGGAVIDWKQDPFGSQFTITNPNSTAQCGCGESFAV